MKNYTARFRQDNILCCKCLLNVVKTLSYIEGIKEFDVNLDKKSIKIEYNNEKLSRQIVLDIVNESIIKGKVSKELYQ